MSERRLIDADALKKHYSWWNDGYKEIFDNIIDQQPTIEERKTGEWCVTPDGMLVCSNCFEHPTNRIIIDGSLVYDMTPIKRRMRYCPNCGSYNGGEEHE